MLMMNSKLRPMGILLVVALPLASCGGGGGSSSNQPAAPALTSIALSPLTVSLPPGGTQQLTVTGTYSGGSTGTLTSGETFLSSNTAVATVSSSGLLTVAANAAPGATATVSATDVASGKTTSATDSTVVTVTGTAAAGPPTASSAQAVMATAETNPLCTALEPFYWEIGNSASSLASGSVGTDTSGNPVLGTTRMAIASASKWIYATYVTQLRGSAANLTSNDIKFLNFTSGYTNMGSNGTACPASLSPDTVNGCLALTNPSTGQPYSAQNPATVGVFDYDAGHIENHASLFTALGNVPASQLGSQIGSELGLTDTSQFVYTMPLLAGAIVTDAEVYAGILRGILSGTLFMHDALSVQPVCTLPSASCPAAYSPIPRAWHYSMGHWIEDDATGDGAFSSPGAYGFYPWIDASVKYYGIIARSDSNGTGEGYASAQCGQVLRLAWTTGVQQ
jgi:hypothetical protein